MFRIFTGNLLNDRLYGDFHFYAKTGYLHEPMPYSKNFSKSVVSDYAYILGVTPDDVAKADSNHVLSCGDYDYGVVAELDEVDAVNPDGSKAALRYTHPFAKHLGFVQGRFFDFALGKAVERGLDVSVLTNSAEALPAVFRAINGGVVTGDVEVYSYGADSGDFCDFAALSRMAELFRRK